MTTQADRIEKKILLRAPRERVWRAITDSKEFGSWFGMKVEGPFKVGAVVHATISPSTADAEVAKMQKQFEGLVVKLEVQAIEPQRLFSFRWHPHALEKDIDYTAEESTLVSFELKEADGGVLLTVSETGFDGIPLARRAKAFAANEQGWAIQCKVIEKYLAHAA